MLLLTNADRSDNGDVESDPHSGFASGNIMNSLVREERGLRFAQSSHWVRDTCNKSAHSVRHASPSDRRGLDGTQVLHGICLRASSFSGLHTHR